MGATALLPDFGICKTEELLYSGEVYSDYAGSAAFNGGGGFSSVIPMPQWQQDAINNYLSSYSSQMPPSNLFDSTKRAYPDISFNGANYMTWIGASAYSQGIFY